MRFLKIAAAAILLTVPLAAQTLHQATPVDELMKQYHAHHHLMAEMEPMPMQVSSEAVTAAATKSFSLVAHQFAFNVTPSPFVVNQGDSVTLDITSSDVTHGFFLEQYSTGAGVTFNKGQHKTVTFVANVPGTFTFFCTESSCGVGHASMTGTFTVTAPAAAPTISDFTPRSGSPNGGTVVAISGTNFQSGVTVKFGETNAVSVSRNSATSLSAMAPAHAPGDVNITVTNPDGQSAVIGTFGYEIPGPQITSINPNSGSTAGGTTITIAGSNFTAPANVTIGGVPATVLSITGTSITAVTPQGPFDISGNVSKDVVVTLASSGQTAAMTGGFLYTLPAPSIAQISPNGSTPNGGNSVVITGEGFTSGLPTNVTFGGVSATNVQVTSPTTIVATVPAHAAGAVDVVVSVGGRTVTAQGAFSYAQPSKKRRAVRLN